MNETELKLLQMIADLTSGMDKVLDRVIALEKKLEEMSHDRSP